MAAFASRFESTSNWLAASAYAYSAFVASTRLARTTVRWAAALLGAGIAYGLVMLFLAVVWQQDTAHAAMWCAGSMSVAVPFGAWVASEIVLPQHRRAGVWTCTVLGMLYPMLLAASSSAGTPVRAMQYLYVAAAAVGGLAAVLGLSGVRQAQALHIDRIIGNDQSGHQSLVHSG
jgi:hypothetical protein